MKPSHANVEAEGTVLGALLAFRGPDIQTPPISLLRASGLGPQHMTHPEHRAFLQAIEVLAEQERPVEPATVWTVARAMPGVAPDGFERLSRLQSRSTCTPDVFTTQVQELKRLERLRALQAFYAEQARALAAPGADLSQAASSLDAFARTFSVTDDPFHTGEEDQFRLASQWDASAQGERESLLPTGIRILDEVVGGWVENLNVVGGGSSIGKSSLVATSILCALRAGHRIALLGLEDGTLWTARRWVAQAARIPLAQVGRGRIPESKQGDVQRVQGELARVTRNLFCLEPKAAERIASPALVQRCKQAIQQHRARAVYVDHALEVEFGGQKGEDYRHRVDRTFSELRSLALRTRTPIIVVVHFNRAGTTREGPPRQEDFAECAGIERMSRLALGLWNSDEDTPDALRVTVLKNTEGRRNAHLVLERDVEAAMLNPQGGRLLEIKPRRAKGWSSHEAA